MEEEKKLPEPEDEEIIDLTDEVPAAPEPEEEIIDLTEIIDEPATQELEISASEEFAGKTAETYGQEDPIDEPTTGASIDEIQFGEDLDEEIESEGDTDDDFVNAMGMDLEQAAEEEIPESPLTEAVTPDQIEAAVERVLLKILPEKIESILVEAIEKTVAREIDKIKGAFLDD
jgi:hypothetical protein